MEITTDISLRGTAWNTAIEKLGCIFKTRTNYMIYMLALSIGIMYDKREDRLPVEDGEEVRSVPRNVIRNNDQGKLDFMFQAAILSTTTEEFSEEERLDFAFGDKNDEKIGFKIREAQMQKIPYMLIIGDKEVENGVVAVRSRKAGDLGTMTLDAFIERINEEVRTKAID